MGDDIRRLLHVMADDESLPPSSVSDAELIEKCREARGSGGVVRSPRATGAAFLQAARVALNDAYHRFIRWQARSDNELK